MKISFEEVLKVIELLNSETEESRILGVSILESFNVLESFQHDCISFLACIRNSERRKEHRYLEKILTETLRLQSKEPINLYNLQGLLQHQYRSSDYLKLHFRFTGRRSSQLLQSNDEKLVITTLKFFYSLFEEKGNGFDLLPLDKIQIKFPENYTEIESDPLKVAEKRKSDIINLVDLALYRLTPEILDKLRGKTLKMRLGYFIRYKKLLKKYSDIKISLTEKDYFRKDLINPVYKNKIGWMSLLDKGIFQGQYLTAVAGLPTSYFPNELEQYPDLQVIYFPESKLKTIPYRLLRCTDLEYLIISTFKSKIKINKAIADHPTLKKIFFEHKTSGFHKSGERKIEKRGYFSITKDEIKNMKTESFYFRGNNDFYHFNSKEKIIIEESHQFGRKYSEYRMYNSNVLENYFSEYPLPIFEDINIENKLLSNEEFDIILEKLESLNQVVRRHRVARQTIKNTTFVQPPIKPVIVKTIQDKKEVTKAELVEPKEATVLVIKENKILQEEQENSFWIKLKRLLNFWKT